jgi:hypothetical protein
MAVFFSLVHGTLSSNLEADGAFPDPKENTTLNFQQLRMGQRELEDSVRRNENIDNRQWVYKNRALFAAASCPTIQSISFLPMHPNQAQLLYAKRGRELAEMKGFISFLDIEHHPEKITEVFQLASAMSISETTYDLNPAVKRVVREILSYIVEDAETLGVALHFPNGTIKPSTFVWMKEN